MDHKNWCLRKHTHAGWAHWLQTGGWSSSQCTEPSSGAWGWGRSPPPFVGSLEAWRKGKIREDTTLMCLCNTTLQCISSLLNGLSQHSCNTGGLPLDVPSLTVKECECCCSETVCEGRDLLGALLQRLDQHLLEGADLLQVSQNERHICTAQPAVRSYKVGLRKEQDTIYTASSEMVLVSFSLASMSHTCQRFEELAGNLSGGSEGPLNIRSLFLKYSATPGTQT